MGQAAKRSADTEAEVLHWFVQMALGLHYMHANRDGGRAELKTQNKGCWVMALIVLVLRY